MVHELNDEGENSLISNHVCVVEFYTKNCTGCKQMQPIMIELSNEFVDNVKFYYCNSEKNMILVKKYEIYCAPTIIITVDGKAETKYTGTVKPLNLKESIERILKEHPLNA